jgi:hypothetical protein
VSYAEIFGRKLWLEGVEMEIFERVNLLEDFN